MATTSMTFALLLAWMTAWVPDLVFGCHAAQIWVDRCGGSSQSPEDCQQVREMREASQAMGLNSLRDLFPESSDDPEGHQEAIAYNRKHMLPTPEGTQILSKMQNN